MFSETNFNAADDDAVLIARDIGPSYHHLDQLESLHCHLSDPIPPERFSV